MIWLWRRGDEAPFKELNYHHILASIDLSVLDRFKFDYATAWVDLPMSEFRPQGLYKYKSVEAAVFEDWNGKFRIYRAKIRFEKFLDAKEFMGLLIGGKIWPKACLDYTQLPSPARHLKELLREAMGIVRRNVSDRFHRIRYASA